MALGSTQPVVKMSTRNIPGGKGGRCVRLTTYRAVVMKSGSLNFLEPSGSAQACYGRALPLPYLGLGGKCWTTTGSFYIHSSSFTVIQLCITEEAIAIQPGLVLRAAGG